MPGLSQDTRLRWIDDPRIRLDSSADLRAERCIPVAVDRDFVAAYPEGWTG